MSQIAFMFWNLNRRSILDLIDVLSKEHSLDVIMLAECEIPIAQIVARLNTGVSAKFISISVPTSSLQVLLRLPRSHVNLIRESSRLLICTLQPPLGKQVLLISAHLPSKMYRTREEQMLEAVQIVGYIHDAEQAAGHQRTVVCGDFNMDPYDPGMVGATAFHSVMSRQIASGVRRTVQGKSHLFFYNPMWSLLGDNSNGPPGTFYYHAGRPIAYYWHMFDQILLRPSLLAEFDNRDLEILTTAGGASLLKRSGAPDPTVGSDHLPLVFRLSL